MNWGTVPEWGLLIIAALTACFALRSLRDIRIQAEAANSAADTARKQLILVTNPRLHIDGVRAADLAVGKQPIFFVKIMNSGPVAADQVAIHISVNGDPPFPRVEYTGEPNKITIPGNNFREYFIKVTSDLTTAHMDTFNRPHGSLRVTGYFDHAGKRIPYCYKYNPSSEPRPEGFAQFIPCDFDTSRTHFVGLTGSIVATSGISGSLTVE